MIRLVIGLAGLLAVAGVVYVCRLSPGDAKAATGQGFALYPDAFHDIAMAPVDGPHILLISVDTLRADHMSLYGYARATTPRIDAFAESCMVFDRAYSTAPLTPPSIVSMLTGLYPYHHRVRMFWQRVTAENITVADHLRRAGYQTAAVLSNSVLTDEACGLGVRFDYYDDDMRHRGSQAGDVTDAAITWLTTRCQRDKPSFLWVHYSDPHGPYTPPVDAPADFTHNEPKLISEDRLLEYVKEPGLLDGLEYVDRYDEEIAYTDREIGRLLDTYTSMGLADDALIILTADHGEQMMDGDRFYFCHGYNVYESVIHIPLLVRYKTMSARRVPQPVSIADVTPTILDIVGLPIPDHLDGRSLAGRIPARPPYAEGADANVKGRLIRALVYNDRKVVVQHGRSNIPRRSWAFDLLSDPGESTPMDVNRTEPAYVALERIILADPDPAGQPTEFAKGVRLTCAPVADRADTEAIEVLKSLGYVE